ncbi:hypothetical protein C8Q77DRAFT_1156856 [Trametes polyzona]|nr:hypothetical protein C8Q77DRAFT_1156856 [Trametes polyzona]
MSPKPNTYQDSSIGDLIIRTSDQVDFYVLGRRIADVSPIFSAMFSLPQAPKDAQEGEGRPVVDVSEPSAVWKKLLPLIHVDVEPELSLEDIRALTEASRKYELPGVRSRMRIHLLRPALLEERPFDMYAFACAQGLEDVALAAARLTLRLPTVPPAASDFAHVSGRAVVRLLQYRRDCVNAARAAIAVKEVGRNPREVAWVEAGRPPLDNCSCRSCAWVAIEAVPPQGYQPMYSLSSAYHLSIRKGWLEYLRRLDRELELLPHESTALSLSLVHPVIVSMRASTCTACDRTLVEEAAWFSEAAASRIRGAIAGVRLVVEA